ncbi:hypothetical protein [Flavobacterium flavigenum]|uniref:hypothetical protein n=1 Tax=Flavobacterium flavigenum TaxID=3003258 RepID=UPI0022ABEFE7|nr:hypothetical protein [Flavobacterium flavigenum]
MGYFFKTYKSMRHFGILILLVFAFSSCNQKENFPKKDFNGNRIYYNVQDFTNNPNFLRIKSNYQTVDTSCIFQKIKALKDIQDGKLVFYTESRKEFELIKSILKKYNVETKSFVGGCLRPGRFDPFCYRNEMQEEIYRRFGDVFIDSILEVSRKTYINIHPKEAYFEDGLDLREKYLSR